MWCFHKWAKWSDPHNGIFSKSEGSIGYFSVCQMRICDKCGKAEYRKLPQMRSLEELKRER
jgi:hypothetical protein